MSQNDFETKKEAKVDAVTVGDKTLTGQEMIDFLVKEFNVKGKVLRLNHDVVPKP